MSAQLSVGGKLTADNALYPWSVGAMARSLLFYAQARASPDRQVLAAVGTYYALFHLGMFLMFACPRHFSAFCAGCEKKRQKQLAAIRNSLNRGEDPSPAISHEMLVEFLHICRAAGLSGEVVEAVERARNVRNFINYGPRVRWNGVGSPIVDTCSHSIAELKALQERLNQLFREATLWACQEGAEGGIWVPHALSDVTYFFTATDRHYGDWCTDDEASVADSLRAALEMDARQKVFGAG